ncbi:hypothetical protein [Paraliomyxa miuraensis]|uniref:hypothetical protein n=1 Tax=Paraliomyxa miuraensis TaxID=376150 RepID=UPI0022597EE5|nr:hypothetical protein [Paraliomyxa miuraensis]MCX4239201.1 hypothetical protein [Paraliomyxa miuraensis]
MKTIDLRATVLGLAGLVSLGFGFGLGLAPATAEAASPDYCAPTTDIDPLQLLRQVSLDLRGRVPSYEEYEWVRGADDPQAAAEGLITEMLESPEYFDQVREYHQALLWGTLDSSTLPNLYAAQRRMIPTGTGIWRLPNMRQKYRNSPTLDCLNQEQTNFDAQGRPIPIQTYADPTCAGGTCKREGWVMVSPYWAPDTQVKVCAYDAQEAAVGKNGAECSLYHTNDELCGCGPELRWCGPDNVGVENQLVRDSLAQEPARIFQWVVQEGRSYLEAFVTDTTFMNGPVAHYYRHNTGTTNIALGGAIAYDSAISSVPDLPYDDVDTWVPVQRDEAHAGAFTTMGYLLRFASNRGRANRFYTAFYCDPFMPSEEGLPPEEQEPSPNLRERNGCNDCHQELEPAAAHWARWRTGGTYGWFSPQAVSFHEPRPDCICGEGIANCSAFCSTYFVTADNSSDEEFGAYRGLPQAASWLVRTDHANVEAGPVGLIDTDAERDQIAHCAAKNLGEHLLGRELQANDLSWLQAHAQAFEDSGYDYTAMVRRMITDERYRTVR